jgi:hypothetical protein
VSAPAALMKAPTATEVTALLEESDRRDRELAARLAERRMGYLAAKALLAAAFNAGHAQAHADLERDWHAIADPASCRKSHATYHARRWGPGGPGHFADPRPADRMPREILDRARASWEPFGLPEPGMVQLIGRIGHHHPPCLPVCYSYEPGWYPSGEAAEIVAAIRAAVAERAAAAESRRRPRGTVIPFRGRGAA